MRFSFETYVIPDGKWKGRTLFSVVVCQCGYLTSDLGLMRCPCCDKVMLEIGMTAKEIMRATRIWN